MLLSKSRMPFRIGTGNTFSGYGTGYNDYSRTSIFFNSHIFKLDFYFPNTFKVTISRTFGSMRPLVASSNLNRSLMANNRLIERKKSPIMIPTTGCKNSCY